MNDRAQLLAALDHLRSASINRAHEHRIVLAFDAAVVIERALSAYAASSAGVSDEGPGKTQDTTNQSLKQEG